jgi:hypothetical protein
MQGLERIDFPSACAALFVLEARARTDLEGKERGMLPHILCVLSRVVKMAPVCASRNTESEEKKGWECAEWDLQAREAVRGF